MSNPHDHNADNVLDWMRSNRLYESSLFFYILIITFFGFVGLFTFGFEMSSWTPTQNLAVKFIYFLFLATCVGLTPLWYRLIFNRGSHLQKRIDEIDAKVASITDPVQRQAVEEYLSTTGQLPVQTKQAWALIFLGWCALFEMFFVSSWVKDMALVWQPDWVMAVIDWVRANTNLPPLNVDRKLFFLELSGTGNEGTDLIKQTFTDEHVFLYSPFGEACLFFQAWRALSFFPILGAASICLWELIGWTGSSTLESKSGFKGKLWLVVATFFLTLMLVSILFYRVDISEGAIQLTGLVGWTSQFGLNIFYIFAIVALRVYVSWFVKFKGLLSRLFG